MKVQYLVLLVGSLSFSSTTAFATSEEKSSITVLNPQENTQIPTGNDIVYLKDGSVIYGTITYYDAQDMLKITANDGVTFELPMHLVLRMEKGIIGRSKSMTNKPDKRSARGISRGYQGYVDIGQSYELGGDFSSANTEVLTSHGFRFNPYFYLGGGLGFIFNSETEDVYVPFYVNVRADLLNKRISPFFDFKLGYTVNNDGGAFVSPAIGVKFNFGRRVALNLALDYTYHHVENIEYYSYSSGNNYLYNKSYDFNNLGFRIGLEF